MNENRVCGLYADYKTAAEKPMQKNHLPSKFDFDLCLMPNWLSYNEVVTLLRRAPYTHSPVWVSGCAGYTHTQCFGASSFCCVTIRSLDLIVRSFINVNHTIRASSIQPNKVESQKIYQQ